MSEPEDPATDRPQAVGPVDPLQVPRYAGPATFARLPRLDEVGPRDVAVVGVPFDAGVSYRPGARFGGTRVREASRLLRPLQPGAGRVALRPRAGRRRRRHRGQPVQHQRGHREDRGGRRGRPARRAATDGDASAATTRSRCRSCAPCAEATARSPLLHFDAHLDTWDTYFGAEYTHGTPFRRAAEEGILAPARSSTSAPAARCTASRTSPTTAAGLRPSSTRSSHRDAPGVDEVAARIRERIGDRPLYISIDIDVLDPAHAPGTGTPEAGGLTSRELLEILRALVVVPWSPPTWSRSPRRTTTRRSPPSPPPTRSTSCSRSSPAGPSWAPARRTGRTSPAVRSPRRRPSARRTRCLRRSWRSPPRPREGRRRSRRSG